jgi:hypothetical protein
MAEGWISGRLLRECIRRLNRSYRALPPPVLRRWWWTLAGGLAAVFALTLAMVTLGRRMEAARALDWERPALRAFVDAAPVTFNTAMWMDAAGNGLVLWLGVLTFAALAAWHGYALRALTLLVGFTAAYVPFVAGWLLWARVRPVEVAAGIATPGGLHSFPSGHVVQAIVAFGILAHLWASATASRAEPCWRGPSPPRASRPSSWRGCGWARTGPRTSPGARSWARRGSRCWSRRCGGRRRRQRLRLAGSGLSG